MGNFKLQTANFTLKCGKKTPLVSYYFVPLKEKSNCTTLSPSLHRKLATAVKTHVSLGSCMPLQLYNRALLKSPIT